MIKQAINKLLTGSKGILHRLLKSKDYKNKAISLNTQFLFIHIPKTGGSSFRAAFENNTTVYKDYGNKSKNTTPEVQDNVHAKQDFYTLKKLYQQHDYAWLTGHVHLSKYINFVPVFNTVAFVREPLEQVLSHYNHYVKHHGFTGDLSDFLDKPFAKNLQSKCLAFMPLGLVGCVGITEHYDDSLALINQQYGLTLASKKINVNNTKSFTENLLSPTLKKKFKKHNQRDIALYEEASYFHQSRVKLSQEDKVWTYGSASINQHKVIHGCAYQQASDEAVSLVVKINDVEFKVVVADEFYGPLVKVNFPRDRYVGFFVPLPKDITAEDNVDIYVKTTGQKLNFKPLRISG